ncbi:MAG: amino acid permease, partial [Lachnospiraceae bacterium]|nr:amino acid permease [Lachnospiraceae bacterium]
ITAYPPRYANWLEYIKDIGHLKDIEALPAFYAAERYMGSTGVTLLIIALMSLVITSLFGNLVALSRLIFAVARDEVLPKELAEVNKRGIPQRAIAFIVVISVFIPFLGRTAIGWLVDVTTLGATIIYAMVSMSAYVKAKEEGLNRSKIIGILGVVFMAVFMVMLLLPKLFTSDSMAKESYCLFTVWALLGIFLFRLVLVVDRKRRRFGRSGIVWIVLMALVLFTSIEWLTEFSSARTERAMNNIIAFYGLEEGAVYHGPISTEFIESQMNRLQLNNTATTAIVAAFFAIALGIIINNHGLMNKRADEHERELGAVKHAAYTDSMTGVKSKHAFTEKEASIDARIKAGVEGNFSIVVCDINGLKQVNDTLGHKAGDDLILKASKIICENYKRSPVYRVGGDEFVAILTGQDYDMRSELLASLNRIVEENMTSGGVVIAAGMADFMSGDRSFKEVFDKADTLMYVRKRALKKM